MGHRTAIPLIQRKYKRVRLFDVFRLLCLSALAAGAVCAGTSDQLIQQVQNRYNHARTLAVHFEEDYSIQGHPRPAETGTLTLKKQGKMRWDYTQPEGKLFLSDGKHVYLYTSRDNRVEKVPLKDTEDMRAPLAFLLGHLDMKKEFRDFQTQPGDGGTWLTASAKTDRLPYSEVKMLVARDGSIRQLEVMGRDESVMKFAFNDEKLNPPVSDSLFQFTIPPGAEVVDAVTFSEQGR